MTIHKIFHFFLIISIIIIILVCTTCMLESDIATFRKESGFPYKITFTHSKSNSQSHSIGFENGGAGQFTVAQRWTPSQLASEGVAGGLLTEVEFMGNIRSAVYTIRIWTDGSEYQKYFYPGILRVEKIIPVNTISEQNWYKVKLDNPIIIPTDQELWIGYHVSFSSGYPASTDQGPEFEGYGNLVNPGNNWITMKEWGGLNNLNYNWMIKGTAEIQNTD